MKIMIKIKSKSDVITNSSSEVYTIISEKSQEELEKILEGITNAKYWGHKDMPWDWFCLMSYEVRETWNSSLDPPKVRHQKNNVFTVEIEMGTQLGTRAWILKNLQVTVSDTGLSVAWDSDEPRIRELWGPSRIKEWEALPDHNILPGVKVCPPSTYSLILRGWIVWNGEVPERATEILRLMFPGEELTLEMGFPKEEYPFNKLLMDLIKEKEQ